AGESDRALAAALDAASAVEVAKDWVEAAERYRFALSALPRRDPRRGELWMKCGDALRLATLHQVAARAYGWAARHATQERARLMARARRAKALLSSGHLDVAEIAAAAVVNQDPDSLYPASTALALVVVTHTRMQRFEFHEALDSADRAADMSGDV